ncbi:hypothetical protein ASC74_18835 [Pseudomonas sp. Root329]|jgi:hypothetical protein|uniref:hypothetical protein n=1 Tax=Pseudomonas sp. Root329 TaxID=1736515 RepID=UPI0006FCEA83|nr:hypothetical protein [Pseudomonas sp. Root329]KQV21110.1 hypothetical protein ASC74_18835 [Pseudomonas sp. Root329]
MYDFEDDDDRTDWEKARDDAAKEHLDKVVPGVPYEDVPDELWDEADQVARDVVGPNPDERTDDSGEEE